MSGSINIKEIVSFQKEYSQYNGIKIFVETGTYKGSTIFHMSKFFEKLYTVELYEKYYKNAVENAEKNNINNIKFYFGDSSGVLPKLILEIKEACIFYLDGHFCGKRSRSVSAQGRFPLFNEIKAISTRNYGDVVIIDDYRLFGKNIEKKALDWTQVTEENIIKNFDGDKIFKSFSCNDRFYILLK